MQLFIYLFLSFLFCAPTSFAMEAGAKEDNAPTTQEAAPALTLEEVAALFRLREGVYVPDEKRFMKMLIFLLVADAFLTVVPGLMPIFPLTLSRCPEVFSSNNNNKIAVNSTYASNDTYAYSVQDRNICYINLSLLSIPALAYLSTIFFYPIYKLHIVRSKHKNKLVDEKIEDFMRGRLQKSICDENDIRRIGQMLLENDEVLSKLSTRQSLILAEVNFHQFCEKKHLFCKPVCDYANKLLRFLEMKDSKLIDELAQENVRIIFKKEPSLWQALVRLTTVTDERAISALKKSLRATLPFLIDHDDQQQIDEIFASVVSGISINDIIAKQAFVEKYEKDKKLTIIYEKKRWNISEKRLAEISDFFKDVIENARQKQFIAVSDTMLHRGDSLMVSLSPSTAMSNKHEIDLSKIHWDLVDVLIKAAFDNEVKINKKNLSVIVEAAGYFHMNSLMSSCDAYIKENNLSDQKLQFYREQGSVHAVPVKNIRSNDNGAVSSDS